METSTSEGKHEIQWTSRMQLNAGEDKQCGSSPSSSRSQYTQREKQDSPIQHSMHQSNHN
ncbi:unnamed protein product [Schistosoma margrebowiei]|uniref:Uncharacterized protein n=1 Tax=Schistosoma margrebowiei TaxID=48269 RepID=A0A183MDX1_9TREM|nr:unnamed protein product [Schistosoma margrebowiei]